MAPCWSLRSNLSELIESCKSRSHLFIEHIFNPIKDTDLSADQGLYSSDHRKTIHLVRHAEGVHNVERENGNVAYKSPEFFDAQLTPLGWQQVDNLRKDVHSTGLSKRIELVICSPLLRAMQTAVGVFGGEGYKDGIAVPPLMMENAGNSIRPAISSLNCPPFKAVELCRERLGVNWCDKRRSISEYKTMFPAIDFSLIGDHDDIWWEKAVVREPNDKVAARGREFLNWLWTRKEKEIAVVTHSAFLVNTLSAFENDSRPSVKTEIRREFKNCEVRSIVIVDRSMIGSDSSTNYPGNIPSEPDVASDDLSGNDTDEPAT